MSPFSVLLSFHACPTLLSRFRALTRELLLVSFEQEFDNYAEWDLRDIDFVEDDSDILHGKP